MPAKLTEEDVYDAWNNDLAVRNWPELNTQSSNDGSGMVDKAPLLQAAASAVAVSATLPFSRSGCSTPSSIAAPQKGSGYATPNQLHWEIRHPPLVFPASQYEGWEPHMSPNLETELLKDLVQEECDEEFQMVPVSNFRIYRRNKAPRNPSEMEPLHVLKKWGNSSLDSLLFDAVISTGQGKKCVQGVPFETVAIDAYNPDLSSAALHVSIQSLSASSDEKFERVWYHLKGPPAPEYRLYHEAFLWVADLTKHAVDFMSGLERVRLSHFQRDFYDWIIERHGQHDSGPFHARLAQHPSKDFRKAVAEHEEFIFKECFSVNDTLCKEPLWKELNHFQDQKGITPPEKESQAVVTEYVYKNFSHMPFQHFLKPKSTAAALKPHATRRRKLMRFLDAAEAQATAALNVPGKTRDTKIRKGDCIAMLRDEGTRWKDKASMWYAYVQDIDRDGRHLDLLWLYEPSMTPLCTGKYPYSNELFLSDHSDSISAGDVACKITVKFTLAVPGSRGRPKDFNFFVRQKYDTRKECFLTLEEDDFRCIPHRQQSPVEEIRQKNILGDVILVHPARPKKHKGEEKSEDPAKQQSNLNLLEPVVLEKFIDEQTISVRRLLRRKRDLHDVKARPNELVWTDQIFAISGTAVSDSQTRCHVRWYKEEQIHRTVQVERTRIRQLISHIPVDPPESSIMKAILADEKNKTDRVPETLKEWYMSNCSKFRGKKDSKSYSRVDGNGLTSTITTSTNQSCGKAGQVLHWRQHRVLTILEARRAQGFPDHEVVVGRPSDQWKIVGNSVARTMALALGMTLREAWLSSPEHPEIPTTCTPTPTSLPDPPPIRQQTVASTLSIKRSSTSRETRTTCYTQDTIEVSQKTTTHTVMSVPSNSSTEPAVKLEEDARKPGVEIIDLGSDTEEEPSTTETQSTTSLGSKPSGSKEVSIIQLSDDTTDSECSAAPKRNSGSSSGELSHDATAKRPKKEPAEEPTIIDLADLIDESSDDLE
ncbi:hypothetical protein IWX90DRAFT_490533 [Phyllosticta citrichinensis]|uniref:DNA (cytosine-5-)-methyltransferase n=1 Tax=Phyllosticta citrichinensis TaxID=1130410 RepID=A0ABR1XG10_9PEZI